MRHESSTVVVLVGEVGEALLDGLGRSPNVSVARPPTAGGGQPRSAGTLDDARLDGGMNLLSRAAITQLAEELAPVGVNALRIGQELFVQCFDVGSVTAREWRRCQQLAKAGSHTEKKSLWTQGPGAKGRYVSRCGPPPERQSVPIPRECYVKERLRSPPAPHTWREPGRGEFRHPCRTPAGARSRSA